MNEISLLLRLVLRLLGAHHPIRLAVGISCGISLSMLIGAMAAAVPHPSLVHLSQYSAFWYVLACAPLMFLSLLAGKKGAPETVVHQVNTVDVLLERSNLSANDKKLVWRALVNAYVRQAKPDLSGTPHLKTLAELELKRSKSDPEAPA